MVILLCLLNINNTFCQYMICQTAILQAVGTLSIMFATQWLYAIVSLTTLALLYMYLIYAIPGASPGRFYTV